MQRTRLLIVVLTCLGWAAWLLCAWMARTSDLPDVHLLFARDVAQMVAGMLSVATMLVFLICPVMLTAKVWRDIGAREERGRPCPSCSGRSNIVPIRFAGRLDKLDKTRKSVSGSPLLRRQDVRIPIDGGLD